MAIKCFFRTECLMTGSQTKIYTKLMIKTIFKIKISCSIMFPMCVGRISATHDTRKILISTSRLVSTLIRDFLYDVIDYFVVPIYSSYIMISVKSFLSPCSNDLKSFLESMKTWKNDCSFD